MSSATIAATLNVPSHSSTGRLRSPRPVTGSRPSSMTSSPSKTIGPGWLPMRDDHHGPVGHLTARQLDLYSNQLTRCLKALGTDAPIRADVQRELATVRAEQESRASAGQPPGPGRLHDVSGLTVQRG